MKWISDLPPAPGDKPQKLSVGDACRRIKDFRLRLNQLTQDIELDGQPLEAETVEEAYIDFSLINYAITKDQAIDAVVKVARSRAYDPVLEWLKDIEKDDSIVPVTSAALLATTSESTTACTTRCSRLRCLVPSGDGSIPAASLIPF